MTRALALATLALATVACGGGGGGTAPGGGPGGVAPVVALEPAFPLLAFDRPVALVQAPGDAAHWYVVEQAGVVWRFAAAGSTPATRVVDISAGVGDSGGERGLFSLAFAPDFAASGHAFLSYTRSVPSLTSRVSRFTSDDGGLTLDPGSEVVVLTLAQPYSNHNGGQVAFGPDGMLYVAFGDGGSGNDPGDRAQDPANLFGTILRIDVDPLPYTIPPGNPFGGNPRCPDGDGAAACPEIHAWGLRNPWRFSFDRLTGELWAADVGQDAWEEIDRIVSGGNYGWRIREGAHCNIPATNCVTAGLTDPVAEYDRAVGRSVTGGFVYRGVELPALAGSYVFADYVTGRVLRVAPGGTTAEELLATSLNVSAFGEDADGELYLVDHDEGGIWRLAAPP
jgi:glucose/arabinose dehydrogenase